MTAPTATTVRDAATVMLVRDAPGLEVFMLRRNPEAVFVGGAHVFPGGALEPSDAGPDVEALCPGRSDADASSLLGVERGGLAFWVAAVRECFEEAGILLARHAEGGAVVSFESPEAEERFARHRAAIDGGDTTLAAVLTGEQLVVDAVGLHYFAHWITPMGAPRRYDTRFFVAAAPPAQTARPDEREAVSGQWVEPRRALDQFASGDIDLIRPTVASLETLAQFETTAEVLGVAALGPIGRTIPSSEAAV